MTTTTSIGIAGFIALASFGLFSLTNDNRPAVNPQTTEIRLPATGTTLNLESFDEIELAGGCDVEVVKGSTNSIEILSGEIDLNNKENFTVEKGKLMINASPNGIGKQISIKVTIAGPLKGLSLSGAGDIQLSDAFNDLEKITIMGSGDVTGKKESTSKSLHLSIMGSGDIDFTRTNCETAHCSIMGSCYKKEGESKTIHAEITGSGTIYYKGDPAGASEYINIGSGKIVSF